MNARIASLQEFGTSTETLASVLDRGLACSFSMRKPITYLRLASEWRISAGVEKPAKAGCGLKARPTASIPVEFPKRLSRVQV